MQNTFNNKEKPIIFMFAGQGSQYYQMGKSLFEENEVFRYWMNKGDEIVKAKTGHSILSEIYHPNYTMANSFDRTLFTHPSIFVMEYAAAQVLLDKNIVPDYLLGVSLGEFVAMAVAGMLPFEQALDLITQQAIQLEKCRPGIMVAIFDDHQKFWQTPELHQRSCIAGINFDQHFVVSLPQSELEALVSYLEAHQINYQKLAVSQAFHSSDMDEVFESLVDYTQAIDWNAPLYKIISCALGKELNACTTHYLSEIARKPMYFQRLIQELGQIGPYTYIDLSPSGTLATFVKYNLPKDPASSIYPTLTPFGNGIKNINKLLDELTH